MEDLMLLMEERDQAVREARVARAALEEKEHEIERLREVLRVVYDESLGIEAWREALDSQWRLRVDLAVSDRDIVVGSAAAGELVDLLAATIARAMVREMGPRRDYGKTIPMKLGGPDAEQA